MISPNTGAAILAVALLGIGQARAQDTAQVVGCYLAEPALTYSAVGNLERGDSSWSHAELSANGKARRPLLRASLDHGSKWRVEGDTLHVTFSDGLVGWRLQLTRAPKVGQGVQPILLMSWSLVVGGCRLSMGSPSPDDLVDGKICVYRSSSRALYAFAGALTRALGVTSNITYPQSIARTGRLS